MNSMAMGFRVEPSGASLGTDIVGLDLSQELDDRTVAEFKEAWYRHLVLRVRGQRLSDAALVAFTKQLGVLDLAPKRSATESFDTPESAHVTTISNVLHNGKAIGELGDAEAFWHQDMTYQPTPPAGAALYALEIPPEGGNTEFCDLYKAYETLPHSLQQKVEKLSCIHDISFDSSGRPRKGYTPTTDPRNAQGPQHPLVRRHPKTERKHLYLGRRLFAYIPTLSLEESEDVLNQLWDHSTSPEMKWTQVWKVGDLILWDNRCTMHRRDAFDPASRRVMHRTQLAVD
jgi:taurine dioxygenase